MKMNAIELDVSRSSLSLQEPNVVAAVVRNKDWYQFYKKLEKILEGETERAQ